MFHENETALVHKVVEGMPRLKYTLPAHTVFSMAWCSVHIDEAHEARTGNNLWAAISALFEVTLIKVAMTATPLIESAEVSIHPPML